MHLLSIETRFLWPIQSKSAQALEDECKRNPKLSVKRSPGFFSIKLSIEGPAPEIKRLVRQHSTQPRFGI